MNFILFDGPARNALLPLTLTRPVADIRIGILTIREKWEKFLGYTTTSITEEYLSDKYPMVELEANVLINASFLPNADLVAIIKELSENQAVFYKEHIIAFYATDAQEDIDFDSYEAIEYEGEVLCIEHVWDIFSKNGEAIEADFELLTEGRKSQPIPTSNNVICPENVFLEEGAKLEFCTLNASTGSMYIGADAEIMEGSIIRGPFALCEGSQVKMGAKIYGPTTVGPHSKVGGEVNNSVIFGYSNKGHDGFLGNSVLGEWCNLGADTNNSNLKNNYDEVKLYSYESDSLEKTGLQFCGLIMGDHSKSGINTMFNTGTVVGVSANIFGGGFPDKYVPSFSWGGADGIEPYQLDKAFETADRVMSRRGIALTEADKDIMQHIYDTTFEKYLQ